MKALLILSFMVAGMFILQSGFRRRLLWSIKVTLSIYAVLFILRLIIWPFIDFDPQIFIFLAGLVVVSVLIWTVGRWLTDRYVRSRPLARASRAEAARAWRSLFNRRG